MDKTLSSKIVRKSSSDELQYILCVVLAPEDEDLQEDIYSAEEIRKAEWTFMESYQNIGLQHKRLLSSDLVTMVDCFVAPVDMTIENEQIKAGTWMIGLHVKSDELWTKIKNGEITGLSIGGSAIKNPITE